ncbi:hypothetical protein [Nostoc sp.]
MARKLLELNTEDSGTTLVAVEALERLADEERSDRTHLHNFH